MGAGTTGETGGIIHIDTTDLTSMSTSIITNITPAGAAGTMPAGMPALPRASTTPRVPCVGSEAGACLHDTGMIAMWSGTGMTAAFIVRLGDITG